METLKADAGCEMPRIYFVSLGIVEFIAVADGAAISRLASRVSRLLPSAYYLLAYPTLCLFPC